MRYLFILALKNIRRAKSRTILTFCILSFGVIIYLIMEGSLEGFDKASFKNFIDFETGHYKIRSEQFDDDHPYDIDNYLNNVEIIEKKLSKMKFITGYTSRVQFLSEIDNGIDSSPVITVGINPGTDNKVFNLKQFIIKGKLEKEGALIGKSLADDMGIGIGDVIYITFRDKEGMYTSIELNISGLVMAGDPKVNNMTVFMNIDEARKHLGVTGANEISMKIDNYKEVGKYLPAMKKNFKKVKVQSWRELATEFAAIMEMKRKGGSYFLIFIVIIALVGIINTLLMSVYEKQQEIGTLMALGMDHREVRNIFIFEGLIIGTLGCIIGLILGTLINLYFIYIGIDYTAMMGDQDFGFNVMGMVKSAWVFSAYVKAFVIVIIASVLSSYYPSKKVMRLEPAECLRTVQ